MAKAGNTRPFRQLHIQKRREALEMTQEELAEIMGVDAMSVSRWERGQRFPRGRRLPQLAKALRCTINDLYREPSDVISLDSELSEASPALRRQALALIKALKAQAEEDKK
jgi:transcriptional regulator with XRE-family HTH domain